MIILLSFCFVVYSWVEKLIEVVRSDCDCLNILELNTEDVWGRQAVHEEMQPRLTCLAVQCTAQPESRVSPTMGFCWANLHSQRLLLILENSPEVVKKNWWHCQLLQHQHHKFSPVSIQMTWTAHHYIYYKLFYIINFLHWNIQISNISRKVILTQYITRTTCIDSIQWIFPISILIYKILIFV